MNITIVIVAEDQGDLPSLFNSLKKNLKSVENLSQKLNFAIVLVGEKKPQKKVFLKKEIKFIKSDYNSLTGKFTQGCQARSADYYLLLDTNTKLYSDCLIKLLTVIKEKKDAAVVIPKVINKKDHSQPTCFKDDYQPYIPRGGYPTKITCSYGVGFLIPQDNLVHLDIRFRSYLYGWRFTQQIKKNQHNYYVPQAKVVYNFNQTDQDKIEHDKKLYFGRISYILRLKRKKINPVILAIVVTILTLVISSLILFKTNGF